MNSYHITSKGTAATTEITVFSKADGGIESMAIPSGNLQGLRLAVTSEVDRPILEVFFIGNGQIGADGRIAKLVGLNPHDTLDFSLEVEKDGQTYLAVVASDEYSLRIDGVTVLDSRKKNGGFALNLSADGFGVEFATFFNLVAPAPGDAIAQPPQPAGAGA